MWDHYENSLLTPSQVSPGSSKPVHWKCRRCHEWKASVRAVVKNCGYCSKCNSLAVRYRDIAWQWDYKRNPDTPMDVAGAPPKLRFCVCDKEAEPFLARIRFEPHEAADTMPPVRQPGSVLDQQSPAFVSRFGSTIRRPRQRRHARSLGCHIDQEGLVGLSPWAGPPLGCLAPQPVLEWARLPVLRRQASFGDQQPRITLPRNSRPIRLTCQRARS